MRPKTTILILALAIAGCASAPRGSDTSAEPAIRRELQGMLDAWKADNVWRIIHDHSS